MCLYAVYKARNLVRISFCKSGNNNGLEDWPELTQWHYCPTCVTDLTLTQWYYHPTCVTDLIWYNGNTICPVCRWPDLIQWCYCPMCVADPVALPSRVWLTLLTDLSWPSGTTLPCVTDLTHWRELTQWHYPPVCDWPYSPTWADEQGFANVWDWLGLGYDEVTI